MKTLLMIGLIAVYIIIGLLLFACSAQSPGTPYKWEQPKLGPGTTAP